MKRTYAGAPTTNRAVGHELGGGAVRGGIGEVMVPPAAGDRLASAPGELP
ncbi:MAG: hypothetical protein ACR2I5_03600 [Candidatus Limnocylindria bacterium]